MEKSEITIKSNYIYFKSDIDKRKSFEYLLYLKDKIEHINKRLSLNNFNISILEDYINSKYYLTRYGKSVNLKCNGTFQKILWNWI